jgi:porin
MVYRLRQPVVASDTGNNNGKQTVAASSTDKGLGIFTHIGFDPQDTSLINFYIDGGLNYKGLIPTRDNDVLGIAVAYGHLQDSDASSNPGYEIVFETTYQIDLHQWLSLQPDLQYVVHPSGTDIANALVLGVRATLSF